MKIGTIILVAAIFIFSVLPSLKDRTVSINKLAITPILFLFLLYQSINKNFSLSPNMVMYIFVGVVIGIIVGIVLSSKTPIKADRQQHLLHLPGNFKVLVTFILIFAVHFVIGYLKATKPEYLTQNNLGDEILVLLLAATSTLSLGGSLCLLYKYKTAISTSLPK